MARLSSQFLARILHICLIISVGVSYTYFLAYVAISLPVIGEGLAAEAWGLRTAGIGFALAVSALAAVCLAAVLVEEARATRPGSDQESDISAVSDAPMTA